MNSAKKSTISSREVAQKSTAKVTRSAATSLILKNRLRNASVENRATFPSEKRRGNNSTPIYDSSGKLRSTLEDVCDCLDKKCEGCHFLCEKCSSLKCGPTCRVNRRYAFEGIEYDGKGPKEQNL